MFTSTNLHHYYHFLHKTANNTKCTCVSELLRNASSLKGVFGHEGVQFLEVLLCKWWVLYVQSWVVWCWQ